jgi:4-carboxymuconolactone decarboxylase
MFGDVWETAGAIQAGSQPDHRGSANHQRQHRTTQTSSRTRQGQRSDRGKEAIIHIAFYAGWPQAMSAITVAKEVFSA